MILSCWLFSCKKKNDVTTPPVVTGTMNISMAVDSAVELIISETGGKILLDSLFTANVTFTTTLHTNDALVDLTTVTLVEGAGGVVDIYQAFTYKAVNLSGWSSYPNGYYVFLGPSPSTNSNITYINAPDIVGSLDGVILFSDFAQYIGYTATYTPAGYYGPATLNFSNYDQHGSNMDYLLFPASGLYNFHTPVSNNDVVDLSKMDTAATVKFIRPAEYTTVTNCSLVGYMDTTNYLNSALLYSHFPGQPSPYIADVEYPRKYVQKYELKVSLSNSNNDAASYYSYGDSVPATLPLADESAYNLSSSQPNNFSVNFLSAKPSYYQTNWTGGKVYWQLNASPDSTTLHPLALLNSLKSKLLQGQDLSSLSLSSFYFESALGLDYPGFFSYTCNPAALKTKRLASSSTFMKNF